MHSNDRAHLLRETVTSLEQTLEPAMFFVSIVPALCVRAAFWNCVRSTTASSRFGFPTAPNIAPAALTQIVSKVGYRRKRADLYALVPLLWNCFPLPVSFSPPAAAQQPPGERLILPTSPKWPRLRCGWAMPRPSKFSLDNNLDSSFENRKAPPHFRHGAILAMLGLGDIQLDRAVV